MTKRTAVPAALVVALVLLLAWYVGAPRTVPGGQPPLATVSAATIATLRADFNRDAAATRVLVLLSPT
jgi:hypothetical protein